MAKKPNNTALSARIITEGEHNEHLFVLLSRPEKKQASLIYYGTVGTQQGIQVPRGEGLSDHQWWHTATPSEEELQEMVNWLIKWTPQATTQSTLN